MDQNELTTLGAAPIKLGASSSRKLTDETHGTVNKSFYLEVTLLPECKLDEILNWVDTYVEGEANVRANLWLAEITKDAPKGENPPKTAKKPIAPSPEPPRDDVDLLDSTKTAMMEVKSIKVGSHPDSGEKTFRVKGRGPTDLEYKGNWTKYGVPVYEALDSIGGFEVWKDKDLGAYDPQPGLQAVCELDGKKPVKVIGFIRQVPETE